MSQLVPMHLSSYIPLLQSILLFPSYFSSLLKVVSRFTDFLSTTTSISSDDEAYVYLLFLFSQPPYIDHLTQLHAGERVISGPIQLTEDNNEPYEKIRFTLGSGTHYTWIRNQIYIIHRGGSDSVDKIRISVPGRSRKPIERLLSMAQEMFFQHDQHRIIMFVGQEYDRRATWTPKRSNYLKTIDQVHMNATLKESILQDIRDYFDPESRPLYQKRGIPYQRGYLLYGLPGTGKTSLCHAIAREFHLPIYVLKIDQLSGDMLVKLIERLDDRRRMIIIEDIDCVQSTEERTTSDTTIAAQKNVISLSTLLNTIDGSLAPQGHILIMTTNHRQKLDPALIRPGRIDMQIAFEYMDTEVARTMFYSFYVLGDEDEKQETITTLASRIIVPDRTLTTATFQNYLLYHRDHPHRAVQEMPNWIAEISTPAH